MAVSTNSGRGCVIKAPLLAVHIGMRPLILDTPILSPGDETHLNKATAPGSHGGTLPFQ